MPETPKEDYHREDIMFDLGESVEGFKISLHNHLWYTLAKDVKNAKLEDWWEAACYSLRDRILNRFMKTQKVHHKLNVKRICYFSLEYLVGRLLTDGLCNTGLFQLLQEAFADLGLNYEAVAEEENDMGLGNGGLGRLAACFLDSLATLDYPAIGYGIHYEYGLFNQEFINDKQVEHPDNWLQFGNPWQIVRPDSTQVVRIYGRVENQFNDKGDWIPTWVDTKTIIGIPWDIPVVGYGAKTINFLRLWESTASKEFDLKTFNEGGYVEAVREKVMGETISKVLYPNDKTELGKELRLVQQYFFVTCSLKDIIRRYLQKNTAGWDDFPNKAVIQLNDTHPAIAIVELMRIFIDEYLLSWDYAWNLCLKIFGYTNHTLMPEALEKWPVDRFAQILPRHLQIIYEINRLFLEQVESRWPGNDQKKRDMSIIEEGDVRMIRMAHLAVIGSHSINGVAELHTELIKKYLLPDFFEMFPERFNNKTNGITPRRWLHTCNQGLSKLINSKVDPDWPINLEKLRQLEKYADDPSFQGEFMAIKLKNKQTLAKKIKELCHIDVNPDALFDVQVKRIHEYKRQHLNLLHILTLYHRLLHDPNYDIHPRVFIFGGKAAPGYEMAKMMVQAINAVGAVINNDGRIQGKLKIAFIPNYRVSSAMYIMPAADLSEQISTAGKEASGTGNMKLALNGALTIGTLDGANVEIMEEVGKENIFIFGLTVEEVNALVAGGYNPWDYYNKNQDLKAMLEWLGSGAFTPQDPNALTPVKHSLLYGGDPFLVLADYEAYCQKQAEVDAAFKDKSRWAKMAILNVARMGKFSSDRTIREYAQDIWKLDPCPPQELPNWDV